MSISHGVEDAIRVRHDAIKRELADLAPYAFADQRHLGYCAALSDVLHLLSGDDLSQRPDSADSSS